MSFFADLKFFIYLIFILMPAIILGFCKKPIKVYSLIASILFLVFVLSNDKKQILFLLLFYVWQASIVKLYLWCIKQFEKNSYMFFLSVLLSVLPLVVFKITGLFNVSFFGFLGISYLTFKVLQIIIEIYDGIIKQISLFDFSSFILFFPSFSSGPIDRSRRYINDLNKVYSRGEYLDLLGQGLMKLLFGVVYKFVFASFIFNQMNNFINSSGLIKIIGYSYSYGFYLFFDFAGYSLMAVGISYILGIKTPDNFNKPFISVDIKEFWNRWHITLSSWLRDFVFSRFMLDAIRNKRFKSKLTATSIGLILTMFIMGLWHGLTGYYIAYGLYHGLLLAITELYQKKSKFYARNKKKPLYKFASWFITLNLVIFGFLIFSGQLNYIITLVK